MSPARPSTLEHREKQRAPFREPARKFPTKCKAVGKLADGTHFGSTFGAKGTVCEASEPDFGSSVDLQPTFQQAYVFSETELPLRCIPGNSEWLIMLEQRRRSPPNLKDGGSQPAVTASRCCAHHNS
jgi:hypothetical protein